MLHPCSSLLVVFGVIIVVVLLINVVLQKNVTLQGCSKTEQKEVFMILHFGGFLPWLPCLPGLQTIPPFCFVKKCVENTVVTQVTPATRGSLEKKMVDC